MRLWSSSSGKQKSVASNWRDNCDPITITGTVNDISAGSRQDASQQTSPMPKCISDASMTKFMEAVYMQQPMPSDVSGVPVILSVIDSTATIGKLAQLQAMLWDRMASLGPRHTWRLHCHRHVCWFGIILWFFCPNILPCRRSCF